MYQPSASGSASSRSVSAVGRAVDDDQVPPARTLAWSRTSSSASTSSAPGQHRELLGRDRVDAHRVEDRQQVGLDLAPGPLEAPLRVDLLHVEVGVDPGRLRPDRRVERVAERVRGVGAEHQGAASAQRTERRRAGGGGGLADTTLAREQENAHRPAAQAKDSTRRLRPLRAVSMMTRSPLRLSMPIIGMAMSTLSW